MARLIFYTGAFFAHHCNIDFHKVKLLNKEIRPAYKEFDSELNTILDEGEKEDQSSVHDERLIIDPNRMKLVEQTIKMLNL